jgi:hypothetical protein
MVVAVCLALPFVSGVLAAARFAFEVMTKRRRTGAVLTSAFFTVLLGRLCDALLDADDFRFNIKYETQIIRFSSEK